MKFTISQEEINAVMQTILNENVGSKAFVAIQNLFAKLPKVEVSPGEIK